MEEGMRSYVQYAMYAYMKISLTSIILYNRIYSEDFEENKSLIISLKCVNAIVRVHEFKA